jgi:hypothetical protein
MLRRVARDRAIEAPSRNDIVRISGNIKEQGYGL